MRNCAHFQLNHDPGCVPTQSLALAELRLQQLWPRRLIAISHGRRGLPLYFNKARGAAAEKAEKCVAPHANSLSLWNQDYRADREVTFVAFSPPGATFYFSESLFFTYPLFFVLFLPFLSTQRLPFFSYLWHLARCSSFLGPFCIVSFIALIYHTTPITSFS